MSKTVERKFTSARLRRSAVALAAGMCLAGVVYAQSTTGYITGSAPAGTVVTATSATGLTRTITVGADGSYSISTLPAGEYTVDAKGLGKRTVIVTVGGATNASFAAGMQMVTVVGERRATTDVSQVDTRTVFTAELLSDIAVGRSVNEVAMLAPGVINSTNYNTVLTNSSSNNNNPLGRASQRNIGSFGGSAASENSYYINGYPVTNPLTSLGATTLGFDSMAQLQVLTGGYGAEYGRSTGGVMSMITKKGTNEWKGGVYVISTPDSLRSPAQDLRYPNTGNWNQANHYNSSAGNQPANWTDNTIYRQKSKDTNNDLTYGGYAGGPLIKDTLFIYVNAEKNRSDFTGSNPEITRLAAATSATSAAQAWRESTSEYPRLTAKVDWNITDNHILEFTHIRDDAKDTWANYGGSYASGNLTSNGVKFQGGDNVQEDTSRLNILKYTGYLNDDLTVSALVGKQVINHGLWSRPGYDPSKTFTSMSTTVVPAQYAALAGQPSAQPYATVRGPIDDETNGYRLDVIYKLKEHELRVGYDYLKSTTKLAGTISSGPGYEWYYLQTATPTTDIANLYANPASAGGFGAQGYYVDQFFRASGGGAGSIQKAYYLEDRWQVAKNVLLSLGARNESFSVQNTDGDSFIKLDNTWQPRLGAVWDVRGDSSLKVFGNIGRYALSVPANVAIRQANGALNADNYYTYTGINADGTPSGLTRIVPGAAAILCGAGTTNPAAVGAQSSNRECGQAKDPKEQAITDLKPHIQDEFIIGMEQALSKEWAWGSKLTYRTLRSAIDDSCPGGVCGVMNPGEGGTFLVADGHGGYTPVTFTAAQAGLPKVHREYTAIDLFAEYQDSKFYGKIEYTWSKNNGNAEGQLNSTLDTGNGGQSDVSVTADWDQPEIMVGSDGLLPNNRTHQFKLFGSYKLTNEWTVGGSAIIQSGRPRSCMGPYYYQFADHYPTAGGYYHYCGVPGIQTQANDPNVVPNAGFVLSPRGTYGETPWTYTFNASVTYAPKAVKGLSATVDVLNVFNTQTVTSYYDISAVNRTESAPRFGQELYYTDPRKVRITARYDF